MPQDAALFIGKDLILRTIIILANSARLWYYYLELTVLLS
jgi:hypothetical protein